MEITTLGDSALLVRVVEDYPRNPVAALRAVARVCRTIRRANLPEVVDIAPAHATVAVFFGAGHAVDLEAVADKIRHLVDDENEESHDVPRHIEMPVCYDAEFAPDLDAVARHAGISSDEAKRLHADARYYVSCVGFTPGFPYLAGLPAELAVPRRSTPRTLIPAGSVAIGGNQTGIYPQTSPGGWNLIGRTPLRLFDPARAEPALLRAGDEVLFRAIDRAEFDRLSA